MKIVRKIAKNKLVAITLSGTVLFMTSCQKESLVKNVGNSSETTSSSKYEDYSGEEIFEGLFFFQNELTEDIPQLKSIKSSLVNSLNVESEKFSPENKSVSGNGSIISESELISSIDNLSNVTIDFINNKYPNFFIEFEGVMKSGNLFEIEKMMTLSTKLIDQSLLTSDKYQMGAKLSTELNKNPQLKEDIISLDLTKEKDVKELRLLLASVEGFEKVNDKAVAFAAVLAVAYVAAAAVSVVAVAYSVVTKVAYWDPTEPDEEYVVQREQTISLIGGMLYSPNYSISVAL